MLSLLLLLMSAVAECLTDVDTVISAAPIRRNTCNPTLVGFRQIVEIQPDLDSRVGHPIHNNLHLRLLVLCLPVLQILRGDRYYVTLRDEQR